jgi:Polyketide cyclase / dehydrase and lipid transport
MRQGLKPVAGVLDAALDEVGAAAQPLAAAWAHLARVEEWPRWAPHITRVDLTPPGPLTPASRGVLHLRPGMTSTFRVTEFRPPHAWRWVGPFLWLTVDYDHRFEALRARRTQLTRSVRGAGFGAAVVGRLFAAIHNANLDRAVPRLIAEMNALPVAAFPRQRSSRGDRPVSGGAST